MSVVGEEIERKFLVSGEAWRETAEGTRYRQGFLSTEPERTVRVRVAGPRGSITGQGKKRGRASTRRVRIRNSHGRCGADARHLVPASSDRESALHVGSRLTTRGRSMSSRASNVGLLVAEIELRQRRRSLRKAGMGRRRSHRRSTLLQLQPRSEPLRDLVARRAVRLLAPSAWSRSVTCSFLHAVCIERQRPLGSVAEGVLVYFHNHGDPGPGVYLPKEWRYNRAQFQEKGHTIDDPGLVRHLQPLPPEGFYRVIESFHCCEKQCRLFDQDALLQLGYNADADPILFVHRNWLTRCSRFRRRVGRRRSKRWATCVSCKCL